MIPHLSIIILYYFKIMKLFKTPSQNPKGME